MRKFKGKRRHRNKGNAQAQSNPASKVSSDAAQQPSVSGLGLSAEVDLDDGKDATNVKDVSPPEGQASPDAGDGVTSPCQEGDLKDEAATEGQGEERVHDDSSDKEEKDGKVEDNNNDKGSDEIETFQERKDDVTLTNGLGDDDEENGSVDDPLISKEDVDDQRDLFIIEESDQKNGVDDNKNNVNSTSIDAIQDTEKRGPELESLKTGLSADEDAKKDTSVETPKENESSDQSVYENPETSTVAEVRVEKGTPTDVLAQDIQGTDECDDVENPQSGLIIAEEAETEKASSPHHQAMHSTSAVENLEIKEATENPEPTSLEKDADESSSTRGSVRYASCSDDIADDVIEPETESAIEKRHTPSDQNDLGGRASSSSSERTESVDHDQFEDAHEMPDEEEEDEEANEDKKDALQEKMNRTSPTIADDVFITEPGDDKQVPNPDLPDTPANEEVDKINIEGAEEAVKEIKEPEKKNEIMAAVVLPVGEIIQKNNEMDEGKETQSGGRESKPPTSSSECPDPGGKSEKDLDTTSDSAVDIGSCVDSHSEIEGSSVDTALDNNKEDNVMDNDLNQLDTSGDVKDPVADAQLQEKASPTPDPSTMCAEPSQQQQQQQQEHDQQLQNTHTNLEGQPLQPLQQAPTSDLDIKLQQKHQQELQQQQQQQQELLQQQTQEIEHLRQQLREQQEAMTRLQAHTHAQQIQSNLLTTSLRTKLRRKEHELKSAKSQHETCISAVISHLLFLEGQMQKEQSQVLGALKEKDDVIRRQRAVLGDVTDKNDRLVMALKESGGYDVYDNGLSRPPLPVVTQNGKYSIQDHGNKVVLRGNKVTNGSHKVRFSSMKERLRRHKSSLELYHTEPLEPLVEGTHRYFGSQENLVDGDTGYLETRTKTAFINQRKQRCRSMIEGQSDLQESDEIHNESPDSCLGEESLSSENIFPQVDSYSLGASPTATSPTSSSSYYYGKRSESVPSNIGLNELAKSRSVPHALPTVSEKDNLQGRTWGFRDRPHSLPSAGLLVGGRLGLAASSPKINVTPNMSIPTTAAVHPPPSSSSSSSAPSSSSQPATTTSSSSSSSSSSISESNPFKSFKNVFKRRGSKKKRSVSLGQTSNQQYQDSIKQHFKKYDLT